MSEFVSAYLGPRGSFSSLAAKEYFSTTFPNHSLVPLNLDALFSAYETREAENILLPLSTSLAGLVGRHFERLIGLSQVKVIAEYNRLIYYALLASPGVAASDLKIIYSHPVAFQETRNYLKENFAHLDLKETSSTAEAARLIKAGECKDAACLAPGEAAGIYGLKVLADEIEKGPHNLTRFVVLGRRTPLPSGRDKTTLLAEIKDRNLAFTLAFLVKSDISILNIFEHPTGQGIDSHYYVFEVSGHAEEEPLRGFLKRRPGFRNLGSYKVAGLSG
ncbi:prephenate dehydratase [Dethiosulfatarculus sandiegensis]|uniref:prephenate dehydratase n=1 Tax=Dethiosulfatarculus sandiegensis TaxID=1429043 RepID=A0A0D2JBD7_9BACT|nr:prephenate dehydratase domain-containing protein [Dethiosulfatarculus sandiegensis]KIX13021.1 hypothetical protein X474_15770 [Dethiosulfatarculus sandiegensis]